MTINPFLEPDLSRRIRSLAVQVKRHKLDALIVINPINRLYLTGFESSAGCLLVFPQDTPLFGIDSRYTEAAKKQMRVGDVQEYEILDEWLRGVLKKKKIKRVGYEGSLSARQFNEWCIFSESVEEWVESEDLILNLRSRKNTVEQRAIREAVCLGDQVYLQTIAELKPGMTEWEIRRILRGWIDQLDAQGESFDTIVAAGANASKPHAKVSDQRLREEDHLLIDMGVRLNHYCSDMTRVVFSGIPKPKIKNIYMIVLDAQLRAIEKIRAGVKCKDVDAVARRHIERKGFGKYFRHRLGHGVGLEIHEEPQLKWDSETILEPGMVVTVEPGIYLPGVGGVRIEDVVVVKKDGCEILTTTPKELTMLDY